MSIIKEFLIPLKYIPAFKKMGWKRSRPTKPKTFDDNTRRSVYANWLTRKFNNEKEVRKFVPKSFR
jgi:hypothetical protein